MAHPSRVGFVVDGESRWEDTISVAHRGVSIRGWPTLAGFARVGPGFSDAERIAAPLRAGRSAFHHLQLL